MHQLDEVLGEFETGIDALESSDEFELLGESEYEWTGESDSEAVFDEVEEMELAAALLEVQSEEELEQFLGGLIRKAGKAIGGFVKSPVGKALGGVLKNVAKTALPIAGKVLGNMVLPGVGGMIGGKLASAAGSMFGLELEGMSPQDQEFEVARRIVRLSGEAARQAAQMPANGSPVNAAKDAVLAAAERHAPGLTGRGGAAGGAPGRRRRCNCGRRRGAQAGGAAAQGNGGEGEAEFAFTSGYGSGGYGTGYGSGSGYGTSRYGSSGYSSSGYGAGGYARRGYRAGPGATLPQRGTWVRRGNSFVLSWQ